VVFVSPPPPPPPPPSLQALRSSDLVGGALVVSACLASSLPRELLRRVLPFLVETV